MIDIKIAILVVIILGVVAEDDFEVPFVCDDDEEVDRIDTKVYECQLKKWAPFPEQGFWDIRVCCYRLERDCVYNKLVVLG